MQRRTLSTLRLVATVLTGISTMGCAHAGRAYWVAGYPPPPPRVIVVPPPPVVYAPAPYYYQSPYRGSYGGDHYHYHFHSRHGRHTNGGRYNHQYEAHPPQIREVRPGEWQNRR